VLFQAFSEAENPVAERFSEHSFFTGASGIIARLTDHEHTPRARLK
jgi:hypothetical protein